MSYNYKYQFSTQGRYALVDCFRRNIWFTTDDESLAHRIKQTFCSKLSLMELDLLVFKNLDIDSITSQNCLQWHVPHTTNSYLTMVNLNDPNINQTIKNYPLKTPTAEVQLIEIDIADRIRELHDQILLYQHIIKLCQQVIKPKKVEEYNQFQLKIDKIFEVEIHMAEIEDQLSSLARQNFGLLSNAPGCVMSTVCGNFYE